MFFYYLVSFLDHLFSNVIRLEPYWGPYEHYLLPPETPQPFYNNLIGFISATCFFTSFISGL